MHTKPMKILILEDDRIDCASFLAILKTRKDFELVKMTDSDIEAKQFVQSKYPDGIIVDIELNNSITGNVDSLDFLACLQSLRESNPNYRPIVIITTQINSPRTYEILHKFGIDLILYKNHPKYSTEHVLNKLLLLKSTVQKPQIDSLPTAVEDKEKRISNLIYHELDLLGISQKLKGRTYIHDAVFHLLTTDNTNISIIQYLTKLHKKSPTTISNGIHNSILHAWRVSSIDDLLILYEPSINHETGVPTPMEFVYYYVDKINKILQ